MMLQLLRRAVPLMAAVAAALLPAAGHANQYPSKVVTVIVPYSAGGSVDAVGRMLAQGLGQSLGQPFVVENRVGASGNIAAARVAKAEPDGYTLLVHNAAAVASNISAFKELTFDPRKDLTPVAIVANQPGVLVVNPKLPVNTVQEFIDYAKSRPGELNYGVGGVFGVTHTPAVLFSMKTGIKAEPVMYKGMAPAITDLVSGQIDFMFDTAPTSLPFINDGRLRILGVTSDHRMEAIPDVPTIAESGVPGYVFNSWIGMSAPSGTPPEIIDQLNSRINEMLADPDFQKKLAEYGLEPSKGLSTEEFGRFIETEIDLYADIVRESGIPPM